MKEKTEKKPRRYKFDKWFLCILAVLLWQLAYILFSKYAIAIPQNWTNFAFWLSMLAVIIAILGWIWLFRIYIRSVRTEQDAKRKEKDDLSSDTK